MHFAGLKKQPFVFMSRGAWEVFFVVFFKSIAKFCPKIKAKAKVLFIVLQKPRSLSRVFRLR